MSPGSPRLACTRRCRPHRAARRQGSRAGTRARVTPSPARGQCSEPALDLHESRLTGGPEGLHRQAWCALRRFPPRGIRLVSLEGSPAERRVARVFGSERLELERDLVAETVALASSLRFVITRTSSASNLRRPLWLMIQIVPMPTLWSYIR